MPSASKRPEPGKNTTKRVEKVKIPLTFTWDRAGGSLGTKQPSLSQRLIALVKGNALWRETFFSQGCARPVKWTAARDILVELCQDREKLYMETLAQKGLVERRKKDGVVKWVVTEEWKTRDRLSNPVQARLTKLSTQYEELQKIHHIPSSVTEWRDVDSRIRFALKEVMPSFVDVHNLVHYTDGQRVKLEDPAPRAAAGPGPSTAASRKRSRAEEEMEEKQQEQAESRSAEAEDVKPTIIWSDGDDDPILIAPPLKKRTRAISIASTVSSTSTSSSSSSSSSPSPSPAVSPTITVANLNGSSTRSSPSFSRLTAPPRYTLLGNSTTSSTPRPAIRDLGGNASVSSHTSLRPSVIGTRDQVQSRPNNDSSDSDSDSDDTSDEGEPRTSSLAQLSQLVAPGLVATEPSIVRAAGHTRPLPKPLSSRRAKSPRMNANANQARPLAGLDESHTLEGGRSSSLAMHAATAASSLKLHVRVKEPPVTRTASTEGMTDASDRASSSSPNGATQQPEEVPLANQPVPSYEKHVKKRIPIA